MGKKIKFPLIMKEEIQIRTIEELRDNFEFEKVMEYYINGKLMKWLEDRYYDEILQEIQSLNDKSDDFEKNLCSAFNVEYVKKDVIKVEEVKIKNDRLLKLKQLTDNEEILKQIDRIAFNQEELEMLLEKGIKEIYLCNNNFIISKERKNIKYIGINNPQVIIDSDVDIDFDKLNICFENIYLTSKKQIRVICNNSKSIILDSQMIKKNLVFTSLLYEYNMTNIKTDWYKQIFLYKDSFILIANNSIYINNLKTNEAIKKFEINRITDSTIYNEFLILLSAQYSYNTYIYIINLENMEIINYRNNDFDYGAVYYSPDYIDVYKDILTVYSGYSNTQSHEIRYQKRKFPNINEKVGYDGSISERIDFYNAKQYSYTYKGDLYRFFISKMKMESSKHEELEKLYNLNKECSIGKFIIYKDKVVATHCEKAHNDEVVYNSAVRHGEFIIFDIKGGNALKVVKAFNKKISKLVHYDNILMVLSEEEGIIKYYDDVTFEVIEELRFKKIEEVNNIDPFWKELNNILKPMFSTMDDIRIYVDEQNRKLAILNDGYIKIYE